MTKDILTGTNGPKGQLWILAALSLPYRERIQAMQDIADMLETTYGLVQSAATRLKARQATEAVQAGYGDRRWEYTSAPFRPRGRLPVALASDLRQPTKAQLMGGK